MNTLACQSLLLYQGDMSISARQQETRFGAFASQTMRALSSAILLLGLIGDRRAR